MFQKQWIMTGHFDILATKKLELGYVYIVQ